MRAGFPKEFFAPNRRGEIFTRLNDAGAGGAGGFGTPSFLLPLNDLGNGIVNTVPAIALGSATPTFTRASANNYAKLASGLWAPVAANIARSHYLGRDTAIGQYGGYLSEPAGVQLTTPTAAIRDMTDASWVKLGITAAKTATGIDGVPNACTTLTCTAPGGTILQTLVAAASARTYSVFLRRVSGSGTIVIQQGATTLDVTAQLNSVTKTRVQLNASILNVAFGIIMGSSGDVIEADFNQFESLVSTGFASSPMASTGAARVKDVLSYPAASNVDFSIGTAYAELSANFSAATANKRALCATAAGSFLFLLTPNPSTSINCADGVNIPVVTSLTNMNDSVRKRASSWGAAGLFVTGDGVVPGTTVFDGSLGSGASIEIGHADALEQWTGTIRGVRIYPTQVTAAQLSAMTA